MSPQNGGIPSRGIPIETYAELRANVEGFARGSGKFLMVLGEAGLGKTEHVKKFVPRPIMFKNRVSLFGLYKRVYKHRRSGRIVVLDDVSDVYRDPAKMDMLKSLTESHTWNTMRWDTDRCKMPKNDDDDGVPPSYRTNVRTILITNRWQPS